MKKSGDPEATEVVRMFRTYSVSKPQLWWPNNLGAQPLYDVTVELVDDGLPPTRRSHVGTQNSDPACSFAKATEDKTTGRRMEV